MKKEYVPNSEKEAKFFWNANATLRAEFGNDIQRWISYCKAVTEGRTAPPKTHAD